MDNLSTSIKLHNINKLIVINHEDCGAAKIVNGKKEISSFVEKKIHKDSFEKIEAIVNKRFPKLKLSFKILKLSDK